MSPDTLLTQISGIGPVFKDRLEMLELLTISDLVYHYPFRYDDFSKTAKISDLQIGQVATLRGEVSAAKNIYTKFGKVLTRATLQDGSSSIELVWFNQSWLGKSMKVGTTLQVSGKVEKSGSKLSILSPVWDKVDIQKLNTGRIVPVYPETSGISSKWLRQKIARLLPLYLSRLEDPLPDFIRGKMISLNQALEQIHFPQDFDQVQQARERLGFDEIFYIQLATSKKRLDWQQKTPISSFSINPKQLQVFTNQLTFTLTSAQEKVIGEIVNDLQKGYPMNRLVQGEVGSGKTVVAAAILYLAHLNSFRSLLMAPTEILAFQHHQTLSKLLTPLGIKVGIYTGSRKEVGHKDKNPGSKKLPSTKKGQERIADVIVGTHALLSESFKVDNVGLIVVDEQQRFGVAQRSFLRTKGQTPHFLTMTATPIPRTVALTIYSDLDLSVIDQLPTERKPIKTYFVPQKKRLDAYKFIANQVKNGSQIYIITPLIEQSETLKSMRAAKVEYERLKKDIFPYLKLGLLHGRLKSKDKEAIVQDFKDQKIDILVSTSVVEVGVDVPNATVMVIEGADHFGLAQLHQLRGRVGRGREQSYTFLFTEEENFPNIRRLKNLENIHNGLKLAELDLKIRGSGEIFGTRQSGDWNMKIADLSNLEIIENAKLAAAKILSESPKLDKYPSLAAKLSEFGTNIMPD